MAETEKIIRLKFYGYYTEEELPTRSHQCPGVYVVYRGNSENLTELLYIGRSGDVANRPSPSHHQYKKWCGQLKKDETLYFSFADTNDEERAEAALIYEIKPKCNCTGKDGFHHETTTIMTLEKSAGLGRTFTVQVTNG
jgi:hypothetical protein